VPAPDVPVGELVEGVACASDPSQTYTLYLPRAYTPERLWPTLLVFDPRGRGTRAAEVFRGAAETYGWILLSSDGTSSDSGWEPNSKALEALLPELRRWPVDPRRLYAAGFSGTVLVAQILGRTPGVLAGILGAGGRLDPTLLPERVDYAFFGTAGTSDFNYLDMHRLVEELERRGAPQRLEVFDGPHRWMPPELAAEGVAWMEIQAMRQGRRPVVASVVETLFAADAERARQLEAAGDALAALRRWRAAARTFEGLEPVAGELAEVRSRIAGLEASRAVTAEEKEERRWARWEEDGERRLALVIRRLRHDPPPLDPRRLAAELELDELQERAGEGSGPDADAARRLLGRIQAQMSFYLPRELRAAGVQDRVAAALSLAVEIDGERPDLWYNLACAEALSGHEKAALGDLGRALDAGWRDLAHLASDPDLETLRGSDGYREIVERLEGLAAAETAGDGVRDPAADPEEAAPPP
jgi:predicted esterase